MTLFVCRRCWRDRDLVRVPPLERSLPCSAFMGRRSQGLLWSWALGPLSGRLCFEGKPCPCRCGFAHGVTSALSSLFAFCCGDSVQVHLKREWRLIAMGKVCLWVMERFLDWRKRRVTGGGGGRGLNDVSGWNGANKQAVQCFMNPQRGFTAKEIGKNLFSFQFRSTADMLGVLSREPWHFDKNTILLKELGGGEQPSRVTFTTAMFWVRIYDLSLSARSVKAITPLGNFIGELVELDLTSLEGVSHSVRLKTRVDFRKPLRKGTLLEVREAEKVWVEFKYERLPSFCYLCGLLGHMRRECDLAEGGEDLDAIPEEKLPFGEWMRASPMRKATVTTEEGKKPADNSLRRKLFDEFTQKMRSEKEKEGTGKPVRGGCELEETQEMKRVREHLASMKVQKNDKGRGEESKEYKMEESKFSPPPPKKRTIPNTQPPQTQS
ncbi:hypothetical protein ACS0TY_029820 [Phlomoides rotata]